MRPGMGNRLAARLERGRAAAEARMLDTWSIYADLGGWSYNPTTGEDERALALLFVTPGRIKDEETVSTAEGGSRTIVSTRRVLHIPVGADPVPANAIAKCVRVHATSDPSLLGAQVRLAGPAPGSQTTARRLEVVEVLT